MNENNDISPKKHIDDATITESIGAMVLHFINRSGLITVDAETEDKSGVILSWSANSSSQIGQFVKECLYGIPSDLDSYPGQIHPFAGTHQTDDIKNNNNIKDIKNKEADRILLRAINELHDLIAYLHFSDIELLADHNKKTSAKKRPTTASKKRSCDFFASIDNAIEELSKAKNINNAFGGLVFPTKKRNK